jgi:hypothetical protein
MSDIGFGNIDFSQITADLASRFGSTGTEAVTGGGVDPTGGKPPETEAERIARLDREAEDKRRAAELAFQQEQITLSKEKDKSDARLLLAKILLDYKLDSLAPFVFELIAQDKLVNANEDMFVAMIKDRPEYQKRFSANAIRLKNNLAELSPGTYIGLENSFKATLKANGLPDNFYDNPEEDFVKWIEGDVAPSELQQRIEQGYNAVANADPEVKRQMQALYNVTESELAAYFLDPTRAKPLIENKQIIRQAQAANIAARAVEQGGVNLASDEARTLYEDLANRGFSEGQIMSAFQDVGKLGELKTTLSGETALSQQDIVTGAFGIDTGSTLELEKRRRRRVGEFAGGGSFARTQGETSGAVTTSVGKAQ